MPTLTKAQKLEKERLFKLGLKYCRTCELILSRSLFYGNKSKPDKLADWCITCQEKYLDIYRENNTGIAIGMKTCKRCSDIKQGDKFTKFSNVCKECKCEEAKQRRLQSPQKIRVSNKRWVDNNVERCRFLRNRWAKNNPLKVRATVKKRKLAKLCRVPEWSEKEAIKEFYLNCPEGMVVDHKIPLQGELVSGLHVLANLQYLTPKENNSKHNKFDPKDPDKWDKKKNPQNFNKLNKK